MSRRSGACWTGSRTGSRRTVHSHPARVLAQHEPWIGDRAGAAGGVAGDLVLCRIRICRGPLWCRGLSAVRPGLGLGGLDLKVSRPHLEMALPRFSMSPRTARPIRRARRPTRRMVSPISPPARWSSGMGRLAAGLKWPSRVPVRDNPDCAVNWYRHRRSGSSSGPRGRRAWPRSPRHRPISSAQLVSLHRQTNGESA